MIYNYKCNCPIIKNSIFKYTASDSLYYVPSIKNKTVSKISNLENLEVDIVYLLDFIYPSEILFNVIDKIYKVYYSLNLDKDFSILFVPTIGCTPKNFSLFGITKITKRKCFYNNHFWILENIKYKLIVCENLFSNFCTQITFDDLVVSDWLKDSFNTSFWYKKLNKRVFILPKAFLINRENEELIINYFYSIFVKVFNYLFSNFYEKELEKSLEELFYKEIETDQELLLIIENNKDKEYMAVDIETNSLDWKNGKIISIQFSLDGKNGYFLDVKNISKDIIKEFLKSKKLIFHNGNFDVKFLYNNGYIDNLKCIYFDTLLAKYNLDPNLRFSLKILAYFYTYHGGYEKELKDELEEKVGIALVKKETLVKYGCYDAIITYKIFEALAKKINQDERLVRINNFYISKIIPSILEMEINGIKIDKAYYRDYSIKVCKKLMEIDDEIYSEFGKINLKSNKQITEVLIRKYGEEYVKKNFDFSLRSKTVLLNSESLEKYNKKGVPFASILSKRNKIITMMAHLSLSDIKSFNKLRDENELIKFLENEDIFDPSIYRKCNKGLLTAYEDGFVYPSLKLYSVISGRLASAQTFRGQVNFLALPKYKDYRKIFISRFENGYLVEIDFDAMEIYTVSHLAGKGPLYNVLANGMDIHSYFGHILWNKLHNTNISYQEFYVKAKKEKIQEFSNFRSLCKNVSFIAQYGGSFKSISELFNIPLKESEKMLKEYLNTYYDLNQYMIKTMKEAKDGYPIYSLQGKRLYLPSLKYKSVYLDTLKWLRTCINFRVQSSAAISTLLACGDIINNLKKSKVLLTVHDSILFDINPETEEEDFKTIKKYMENCTDYFEYKHEDLKFTISLKEGLLEKGFFDESMQDLL